MTLTLDPAWYGDVALQPLVQRILDDVPLCAMATVNPDGAAHVNTAFYCVDEEWRVFFVSADDAQHTKNLGARSSMAVAVYASSQDWDDWKAGVQLFGRCAVAHGRDAVVGGKLYRTKFPAYGDWLDGIQGTVEEARAPTLFVFVPESLKILQEEALGEETFVTISLVRD